MIFVLLSVWIDPSFFCRNPPHREDGGSLREIESKLFFHSVAERCAL